MASYIYVYRLTTDTGNAPCIFESGYKLTNLLSLACCKGGQIREKTGKPIRTGLRHEIGKNHMGESGSVRNEVFVVGTFKDHILYVARISSILPADKYFDKNSQYRNRQDCIYEFVDEGIPYELDGYCNQFKRRSKFNEFFHYDPEGNGRLVHDIIGGYVLLSEEFVYMGETYNAYEVPKEIREVFPKRQERKVFSNIDGSEQYNMVRLYLDELMRTGYVSNNPIEKLECKCMGGCQK